MDRFVGSAVRAVRGEMLGLHGGPHELDQSRNVRGLMMTTSTEEWILQTLKIITPNVTINDFRMACHSLIADSDFVEFDSRTYSRNEITKLADGIYSWILGSPEPNVELERDHDLFERVLPVGQLASMMSSDLLFQYLADLKTLPHSYEERLSLMIETFAAICFRYLFCTYGCLDVFPASILVTYVEAARKFFCVSDLDTHRMSYNLLMTLRGLERS